MRFLITILLLQALVGMAFAQQKPSSQEVNRMIRESEKARFLQQQDLLTKVPTPNQRQFDIHSYTLNLSLWPDIQRLEGAVVIQGTNLVASLGNVEIDLLSNMVVDSIKQNATMLNYTRSGDLLNITLASPLSQNEQFSIEIYYYGNPQSGGLGTWGWSQHSGIPMIWTLSQPFGAPAWWPCKDDPSDKADSVFINVTIPDNLVLGSEGLLTSITPMPDNRHAYHWRTYYPISTYLVSLAITNYSQFSDWYVTTGGDSMELQFFVYPEDLSQAQTDFSITKDMIAAYAQVFGEYPFLNEKYGMAAFPWSGGMEHQTLTSFGANLITGYHYYDWIIAHELSHQWFGDCITMKKWSHIWMNEGFASYAEALWEEHLHGTAAYHSYLLGQDPGSFNGSLFVYDSLNANALFANVVYDKGSWALHMLRGILGDSLFFRCLKSYATSPDFAYGNATTEDFRDLCENISGQDLHWFFEEWVYHPGRPHYTYSWQTSGSAPPYATTLSLSQSNTMLYKMPLQIRLYAGGQDTIITVWDSLASQNFQLLTEFEPTGLQVDPDHWVLKTLNQGSLYSVSGRVIDAGTSAAVANAEVYWEGPYDPLTGAPLNWGSELTNSSGNFQLSLVSGDYAFVAIKDTYVRSPVSFRHVSGIVSNLQLSLSQPVAAISPDSLHFVLNASQTADSALAISNSGSGDLFVQAAISSDVNAAVANRKAVLLRSQLPSAEFFKSLSAPANDKAAPVDSLWQHLHHDRQENAANPFDLSDTYIQKSGNIIYTKFTTYQQPASYDNLRINVFVDADRNPATGLSILGMGAEYLVLVGDLGAGYNGYVTYWNPAAFTYEFVGFAAYFQVDLPGKSVTIGVDETMIGSPQMVNLYINDYNLTDLVNTVDYVPASNLGYLTASLVDVPWLKLEPLYDLANADSSAAIRLTVDPHGLTAGHYLTGVALYTTSPSGMQRTFIPVQLDYLTGIGDNRANIPAQFEVSQNYPNPFNPETSIRFGLPAASRVTLEIFNVLGQRIYLEESGLLNAGYHVLHWNGKNTSGMDVSSGIYFYKISAGKNYRLRKLMLLR